MKFTNILSLTFYILLTLCSPKQNNKNLKRFLNSFGVSDIPFIPDISNITNTSTEEGKYINVKCLWVNKYNVYSLQKLQNKNNDYIKEFDGGKIIFNLCQNTVSKIGNESSGSTFLWQKLDGNITKIAGSIDGDKDNKNTWSEFTDYDRNSSYGIAIKLIDGDKCELESVLNHQTYFKLYCDPQGSDEQFYQTLNLNQFRYNTSCTHIISATSVYGCALNSIYIINRAFQEFKVYFIIGFIVLGLFLCYFGHKFITVTIVLVTGIIGCFVITLIVLNLIPKLIQTETAFLYLLGAGFVIGTIGGFLLKSKVTVYVVILGGSMGYSVGVFVSQFIQGFVDWNPDYLYYGSIVVFCIIGGILGLCALKLVLIAGTAIIGGYITMRGFVIWFGGYIDERQIIELFRNKEYEQITDIKSGWTYAYLILWALLSFGGTCYQIRGHKDSNVDDYKKA